MFSNMTIFTAILRKIQLKIPLCSFTLLDLDSNSRFSSSNLKIFSVSDLSCAERL